MRAQDLRIDVSHPADKTADVRVALYTSPETWLETPAFTAIVAATDTLSVVRFSDLPAGVYGAAIYQDQNRNGKLDRNLVGWFKEPFGFSERARARFGPPKWEDALFTVGTGELRLRVRIE
ncbi:MAG: DUF2141 domain-containing protein [Bacteroidetes bacterium]|nr:DUF2141 domain-containing protein [Bacteroidota bacterium]MDA0875355.1 DUF2141 domain-containing protein [Bacteroidota bacterium]